MTSMQTPATEAASTEVPGSAEIPGSTEVPGFIDSHAHLLKDSARVPFPWPESTVSEFHRRVAGAGTTPMDVPEPPAPGPPDQMAARLLAGLARAASTGLVEITEMGMRDWWYLDSLARLQLVSGRSDRDGFRTHETAPGQSRLAPAAAFGVMSDEAAGRTLLSADPRTIPVAEIDQITVRGTAPMPF